MIENYSVAVDYDNRLKRPYKNVIRHSWIDLEMVRNYRSGIIVDMFGRENILLVRKLLFPYYMR